MQILHGFNQDLFYLILQVRFFILCNYVNAFCDNPLVSDYQLNCKHLFLQIYNYKNIARFEIWHNP
jgi:hypothetical protein